MPFAHYLERRFAQLVREQRAKARRQQQEVTPGDEALDGLGREGSDGAVHPADRRHTVDLEVDGERVSCVDIAEVADTLGTSISALQERERRGTVRFLRHEGRRYLPVEDLAELEASEPTNEELAEELDVNERTIRRWKQEAPPGLNARQLRRHLQQKADERRVRRYRDKGERMAP